MVAILDSSFLFALTNGKDRSHDIVLKTARGLQGKSILPDVVLPEVCHLILARLGHFTMRQFLRSLDPEHLQLEPLHAEDLVRARALLETYANIQLDLADAAIIAIAERLNITQICTLDRRDFSIVRPRHCEYFEVLP
ncbi:MAG: type II toxin-antitoxin system VapC family toxin [Geitlerinemataceae cyanobacterium]